MQGSQVKKKRRKKRRSYGDNSCTDNKQQDSFETSKRLRNDKAEEYGSTVKTTGYFKQGIICEYKQKAKYQEIKLKKLFKKSNPKSQAGITTQARWQKLSLFVPGGALLMAGTVAVPKFIPAARRHRQHAHHMYIYIQNTTSSMRCQSTFTDTTPKFLLFCWLLFLKRQLAVSLITSRIKKRNGQQMNN